MLVVSEQSARDRGRNSPLPFRKRLVFGIAPSIRLVRIVAAALMLAVLGAAAMVILHNRGREVDQASRSLQSLGAVLSEQTTRTLQSAELVVDDIATDLTASGLTLPQDLARRVAGPVFHDVLRGRISGMPQLDAVSVIGADGRLVNFSRPIPIPPVNVADRDYFRVLRDNPDLQTFLSAPVENRGTGTWTMYIARRLNGPNRSLLGLVLGAIESRYFEKFYSTVNFADGIGISLWRQDGVLLAHFPDTAGTKIGKLRAENFDALPPGGQRVFATDHTPDGLPRLVVATHLAGEPLVVCVSRTQADVLADWRSDSAVIAVAAATCAAAIFAIMLFLTRQIRAFDILAGVLHERDDAERRRREAEAQLLQGQKLEAIGRVAAGVAHDFNNLLMVVLSNAELLGGSLRGDAQSTRRLATISQAVDRGSALTQQMLAFSRQQILLPAAIDLNAALCSIEELLRSSLGGTVRLRLILAESLWPVQADPGQLEHAILNLVINARDAMPGGGDVVIRTANRTLGPEERAGQLGPGDYVVVTIADTGNGMTAEVMARAFEPFFTTKDRGEGSGLGLSQVFGFVRQSQGDVLLETEAGRGTTISILLPRVTGGTRSGPAPDGVALLPAAPDQARPVVMVVDDDDHVREAVACMLEDQKIDVVQAASGPAALRLLGGDRRVGLVLTDFAMPGMTGAELAERVRLAKPELPVVFMTGYARPEPLRTERWVLRKPFTARFLTEMLNQISAAQ